MDDLELELMVLLHLMVLSCHQNFPLQQRMLIVDLQTTVYRFDRVIRLFQYIHQINVKFKQFRTKIELTMNYYKSARSFVNDIKDFSSCGKMPFCWKFIDHF